jgi:esterase/lipase
MGGALAAYLASNFEVRKLILLAPANKYINFRLPFSKIKNLIKIMYALQKAIIKKDSQNKKVLKQRIKHILQDDFISLRYARDKYLKSNFRHAFRNFRELIRYVNEKTIEIKCPSFIAWGRLDQVIPLGSVKFLYDLCTNEQKILKKYDDLSHLLLLSPNCDELVQDIEKFLVEGGNS